MKVGLAISGGAAKSISALGCLQAIIEMGLAPDFLSGSSGGAIVSTFYAAGFAPEEQVKMVMDAGRSAYLRPTLRRGGWFDMRGAEKKYRSYLGDVTFKELSKRVHITTTDIHTGEAVVYNEGRVIPPLVASSSMPGIFAPVNYDGKLLVDGSVADNLPAAVLRPEVDLLIGIVTAGLEFTAKAPTFREITGRSIEIGLLHNARLRAADCDFLLTVPGLEKYGTFEINKGPEMFKCGYDYALGCKSDLLQLAAATSK